MDRGTDFVILYTPLNFVCSGHKEFLLISLHQFSEKETIDDGMAKLRGSFFSNFEANVKILPDRQDR